MALHHAIGSHRGTRRRRVDLTAIIGAVTCSAAEKPVVANWFSMQPLYVQCWQHNGGRVRRNVEFTVGCALGQALLPVGWL